MRNTFIFYTLLEVSKISMWLGDLTQYSRLLSSFQALLLWERCVWKSGCTCVSRLCCSAPYAHVSFSSLSIAPLCRLNPCSLARREGPAHWALQPDERSLAPKHAATPRAWSPTSVSTLTWPYCKPSPSSSFSLMNITEDFEKVSGGSTSCPDDCRVVCNIIYCLLTHKCILQIAKRLISVMEMYDQNIYPIFFQCVCILTVWNKLNCHCNNVQ